MRRITRTPACRPARNANSLQTETKMTMARGLAGALPFLVWMLWTVPASAQPVTFTRADYPADTGTRGIASGDFNGDHWPDIATADTGVNTVSILLNKGNGQGFTASRLAVSA